MRVDGLSNGAERSIVSFVTSADTRERKIYGKLNAGLARKLLSGFPSGSNQ